MKMATHEKHTVLRFEKSDTEAGFTAEYELYFPATLIYFQGHFSDFPLLPGIAQVDMVMTFSRSLGVDGGFSSVERLKFVRPIFPERRITLTLNVTHSKSRVNFQFSDDDGSYSQGRILLGSLDV